MDYTESLLGIVEIVEKANKYNLLLKYVGYSGDYQQTG